MARPLRVFVAESQIQSQFLRDFPIVLDKGVIAVAAHQSGSVTNVAIRLVWQTKQECRERLSGAVNVLRICRRILREREDGAEQTVVHISTMLDIRPYFQEMLALDPA